MGLLVILSIGLRARPTSSISLLRQDWTSTMSGRASSRQKPASSNLRPWVKERSFLPRRGIPSRYRTQEANGCG